MMEGRTAIRRAYKQRTTIMEWLMRGRETQSESKTGIEHGERREGTERNEGKEAMNGRSETKYRRSAWQGVAIYSVPGDGPSITAGGGVKQQTSEGGRGKSQGEVLVGRARERGVSPMAFLAFA